MLSLSPRADLFGFKFPKDFLPKEINDKYTNLLNKKDKSVIRNAIDYLNESIQSVSFPGLSDLLVEQTQHSKHPENHNKQIGLNGVRVNVEPARNNNTYSPANILSQINGEFTVTLRKNQGLYNYFMIYESIFHKVLKEYANVTKPDDFFEIDILEESGEIFAKVKLFQPRIDGIDGLEFSFNKLERQTETFDIKFKFNNIDFEIL